MEMHNKIRRNCCHALEMKGKIFYRRVIKQKDYSGGLWSLPAWNFSVPSEIKP